MREIAAWQGKWAQEPQRRFVYLRGGLDTDSPSESITGNISDMATSNVTVSVESDLLEQIRAEAEASGISVSAWMARAARAFARKDRVRRHKAWLSANADISEELAAFEEFAQRNRPGWSSLGEPA